MEVRLERRVLRFARPVRTAYGALRERELLELTIRGADGVEGRGEAAPLEPYDGVPTAAVEQALRAYAPILRDGDDLPGGALLDACREAADLPQALAAVDMALWDRAGRREGRPVCALITDDPAARVRVNASIAAEDRAGAATAAADAARAGYTCVKVKVGVGDDAGRVAAVRAAAGPDMELRLDANGAWAVDEAVATIEALAPAGLELVEEPVHGVAAMRAVRERVAVRIAMDETAGEPGSLTAAVADAVCLKVGRCGGISGLLAQAALVRATGAEVYLASAYDGPLGIAAAVHCAAALRPSAACGLGTLALFAGVPDSLPVRDGAIAVPAAPGLGVGNPE
jgi:L-Ala-D/L-Glu epimerase